MELSTSRENGIVILSIDGKIGDAQAVKFRTELERLVQIGERKIVLDLKDVQIICSQAVATLLAVAKNLDREGSRLRVAAPSGVVESVMRIMKLNRVLDIFPSLTKAKQSFS